MKLQVSQSLDLNKKTLKISILNTILVEHFKFAHKAGDGIIEMCMVRCAEDLPGAYIAAGIAFGDGLNVLFQEEISKITIIVNFEKIS